MRKSKNSLAEDSLNCVTVELPVIAPYDWNHLWSFLQNHRLVGVEELLEVDRVKKYRRVFSLDNTDSAIELEFNEKKSQLQAKIYLSQHQHLRLVVEKIRDLFDTRTNPHLHLGNENGTNKLDTGKTVANDKVLSCYQNAIGIRVPGSWDSFETAIGIILGQLVSVEQARQKVQKLIEQFGRKSSSQVFSNCNRIFPTPEVLMLADLKNIGVTKVREHAIRELSKQVHEQKISLSRTADIEKTKAQLLEIRGIGQWTVEMIAMRCLGDTNAFPKTDLIIKRALELHSVTKGDWSPWNAYISLALWKTYAQELSKKSPRLSAK